jgi:RNA polymerase sigma factor (sigma-70 family)
MSDDAHFQKVVLTHLDDAYGLARWLIEDRTDLEKVVEDACLSAIRGMGEHFTSKARIWVLGSVHRAAYQWLNTNPPIALANIEDPDNAENAQRGEFDSEAPEMALRGASATQVVAAFVALPVAIRETIVLRDILGLSYRDIAEVTGAPTTAVMRRLAQARHRLLVTAAAILPDCGGSSLSQHDENQT